ncbi:MAG TPA: tRNA (adenosine(37)-N6)-threonylcarbamoyltransferase complex ATPase subunit type 1 TsaE [Gammaproteobacteria bacterium]|nr:tRNA (adenosine(37)-N6)-threonylcarbamoyltransferase complex ATPase subunit type 1 TsaE [Gammaproteobacteria bacterium]
MVESALTQSFASEGELARRAAAVASAWRSARLCPLRVGLRGDLGSGKTTWVRAMLRGLGYTGRVPSPTYTLIEQYALEDLTVAHLDLYRLRGVDELENLGFRDWLAAADAWLLIEWPERAGDFASKCDLELEFRITQPEARAVAVRARSEAGRAALEAFSEQDSNNAA